MEPTDEQAMDFAMKTRQARADRVAEWLKRLQSVGMPVNIVNVQATINITWDDGDTAILTFGIEPE